MKLCTEGAELSHADGRMDITKLIVAFLNFADAPKTMIYCHEQRKIRRYKVGLEFKIFADCIIFVGC